MERETVREQVRIPARPDPRRRGRRRTLHRQQSRSDGLGQPGGDDAAAGPHFIPLGIALRTPVEELTGLSASPDVAGMVSNLVPVTLGNIAGGTLLLAAVYRFVYLRGVRQESTAR
jgi:hypothetical protein